MKGGKKVSPQKTTKVEVEKNEYRILTNNKEQNES